MRVYGPGILYPHELQEQKKHGRRLGIAFWLSVGAAGLAYLKLGILPQYEQGPAPVRYNAVATVQPDCHINGDPQLAQVVRARPEPHGGCRVSFDGEGPLPTAVVKRLPNGQTVPAFPAESNPVSSAVTTAVVDRGELVVYGVNLGQGAPLHDLPPRIERAGRVPGQE